MLRTADFRENTASLYYKLAALLPQWDDSKRSDSESFQVLGIFVIDWAIILYLLSKAVSHCWPAFHLPGVSLKLVNLPLNTAHWEGTLVSCSKFSRWPTEYRALQSHCFFLWPLGYPFWTGEEDAVAASFISDFSSLWIHWKSYYLWMSGSPIPS